MSAEIKFRIEQQGPSWCFTPSDFSDLSSNEVVRQTLSRLQRIGFIDRLAKGIYYFPRYHETLGKLPPNIEAIVEALQNAWHIKCQPTGAYAANLLGLSEQVAKRVS